MTDFGRKQTNWVALACCLLLFGTGAQAQIKLTDDAGNSIELQEPARRIISLAPHITELLFAAGAGDHVVGVVSYSDYPPQARKIEKVGSYIRFDLEKIVSLQPDLIVAWKSGNPASGIEELRRLGYKVFVSEPRELDQVASNIEQLGWLTRTEDVASLAAHSYREGIKRLRQKYAGRKKVSVFFQVSPGTLYTLNGEHIISKVIDLCGGVNVFSALVPLAAQVSLEAVVQANPQVIIGTHDGSGKPAWFTDWLGLDALDAVRNNNIFYLHPDIISRHTTRILLGAEKICQFLDQARSAD